MKIGINYSRDLQNVFSHEKICSGIATAGASELDYEICGGYCTPDPIFYQDRAAWVDKFKRVKKLIDDNGLNVNQTHCTYATNFLTHKCGDITQMRLQQAELDIFKKELEATAMLGAKYTVVHPINFALYDTNKRLNNEVTIEAFSLLEPTLREFDLRLGVENMFTYDGARRRLCPTGCSSPSDMAYVIDTVNGALSSDRFVACLDTGHTLINCDDIALAVKTLGNRLKFLHVHDNDGIDDMHAIPGSGKLDWAQFCAALKQIGYDGVFSMELNLSRPIERVGKDYAFEYIASAVAAAKAILRNHFE